MKLVEYANICISKMGASLLFKILVILISCTMIFVLWLDSDIGTLLLFCMVALSFTIMSYICHCIKTFI